MYDTKQSLLWSTCNKFSSCLAVKRWFRNLNGDFPTASTSSRSWPITPRLAFLFTCKVSRPSLSHTFPHHHVIRVTGLGCIPSKSQMFPSYLEYLWIACYSAPCDILWIYHAFYSGLKWVSVHSHWYYGQDIKFQPKSGVTTDIRVASPLSVVLLAMSNRDHWYELEQFATKYNKIAMRISTSNYKFMTLSLSLLLSLSMRCPFDSGSGENSCWNKSSGILWIWAASIARFAAVELHLGDGGSKVQSNDHHSLFSTSKSIFKVEQLK